ncbi:MAG: hypothetical protein EXS17_03190 [Phycisphaerales bacterium]|nr:hypothetical protein [Phycisphaerales bacterium]
MKCDLCDKAAVVHEIIIRNGVSAEVHLCAEHAIAAGYPLPIEQPIADIFPQIAAVAKVEGAKGKERTARCGACGLTYPAFRKSGHLGCPACYDAFSPLLDQVIERAQAGATHHVGRSPRGGDSGASAERVFAMRAKLMRDLESAVAAEQYERAAKLRDELKTFDSPTS